MKFKQILNDVIAYSEALGFKIEVTNGMDDFFKGDLDGVTVYTSELSDEDNLFNIVHMVGHSIQWNVSNELRQLGSVIHKDPSDDLLRTLQEYEWEANCYGLEILCQLGYPNMKEWLEAKFIIDMLYLTHYYKTGEKLREITPLALEHAFKKPLVSKVIPSFIPRKQESSRNGIVIDFSK